MRYRKLGKWGVKLSSLGLGSYLTIGYKCDDETSRELIRTAYENGINYFDTANAYNGGRAEKVLGKYLKDFSRSSLFVLTKVWAPMGEGPNDRGLSAKHIIEQCGQSLKRLGMDYVDAYMCHRHDPDTPLEETVRAMEDLARQGKILYWGISEWPADFITRAMETARAVSARPLSVSQPRYNLLYRNPETELFPLTAREGIGNVVFSPLAHGMLTAKYLPGKPAPAGTRAASEDTNAVMKNFYWSEENKLKAGELARIASEAGVSAAQLAIAWCLDKTDVTSVILGAGRVEQLEENLGSLEIELTDDLRREIESVFPRGSAAPLPGKGEK